MGSNKSSGRYSNLQLCAVSWMFRNSVEIKEYDGLESVNIYIFKLLEKYSKKIDEIIDVSDKNKMWCFLFNKLINKQNFIKKYMFETDVHMDKCNDRLNKIINKK